MHDLSLKPGRKTSEWIAFVTTATVQWTAVALTVLTDAAPVVPEKWSPWVILGVSVLTSVQAIAYSAGRHDLKKAAIEATVGFNAAKSQVDAIRAGDAPDDKSA